MKRIISLFILVTGFFGYAQCTSGTTGAAPGVDYVLVWADEFEVDGPPCSDNWFHQTQLPPGGSWYNGEVQHYTDRLDNSFVSSGNLSIVAMKETFTDQGETKNIADQHPEVVSQMKDVFKNGRFNSKNFKLF